MPNVDALFPAVGLKDRNYHCGSFYHSLFFPVIFGLLFLPLGLMYFLSILVGGAAHLLMDSLDYRGRPWFYPFSKRELKLKLIPYEFKHYVKNPVCKLIEAASISIMVAYVILVGLDYASAVWIAAVTPWLMLFMAYESGNGKVLEWAEKARVKVQKRRLLLRIFHFFDFIDS
jgi:hypothetical protein